MIENSKRLALLLGTVAAALGLPAGCDGGRSAIWAQPVETPVQSFGLNAAVAIVDRPADRLVLLRSGQEQSLTRATVTIPRGIVNAAALPDGSKLFVLSAGHRAHLGDSQPDVTPALTVIDGGATAGPPQIFDLGSVLSDPLSGMALDPAGRWVVLFAGPGQRDGVFVENPNELVIVDLSRPIGADNPTPHTLRSFGGRPVRLTFTPALDLPAGKRHLLVVESDQDVSLLQLENPALPEITVPLTSGADARRLQPAGIAVDDGDPARNDDARIGIRLNGERNVIILQLEAAMGGNGYKPTVNLTDVGGVPSDIAFVRTDGGLRLAALVPATRNAVLVDPVTSLTTPVMLPAPYTRLSLITDAAPGSAGGGFDVGLLWNDDQGAGGVAFWSLGQIVGQAFRSIEAVPLGSGVGAVLDVPAPNRGLKILQAPAQKAFYVLDLQTRTAAPLLTSVSGPTMLVSPAGDRVWTFAPGGTALAAVDLVTKHPRSLLVDRNVNALHEIAREGGGRALVAIHGAGNIGATVYDAVTEDDQTRRLYAGLLTEGTYADR